MYQRRKWTAIVALLAVAILSASQYGCRKRARIEVRECTTPSGEPAICVVVVVDFSSAGSVTAGSLYQTREIDPNLLEPALNATPTGTLSITLNSGAVVSHSGTLYLDSGTNPSPHTAGHEVLVYRPSDPSALQSFINQYQSNASSATLTVDVMLRDVSGPLTTTTVDTRGSHDSSIEYLGSVSASVGDINEEYQDF